MLSCGVCPSVCHTGVLCRNNRAHRQAISTDCSLRTPNTEHISLGDPSSGALNRRGGSKVAMSHKYSDSAIGQSHKPYKGRDKVGIEI